MQQILNVVLIANRERWPVLAPVRQLLCNNMESMADELDQVYWRIDRYLCWVGLLGWPLA